MWPFSRLHEHRYCAFCKVLRRVYVRKHVGVTNVLQCALFALTVTYAAYQQPDPIGMMIFVLALIGAEIFIYTRWRMNIICNLCGFDPILYKKSADKASLRVKEFFKEQVENPEFWLTKSPLLAVQKRIREQERKKIEYQRLTSRSKSTSLAPPPVL
jgi:hypothetical protein